MRHDIVLAPEAQQALRDLPAQVRSQVRGALEVHLRFEPMKVSRSRIERLRGLSRPQYRLRIGDIRVFYDVTEATVEILTIVTKAEAQAWLDAEGSPTRDRGAGASQG
jgi:mRNA-degrading endonuclease RelE of RelBE toxin-antitoxin system